MPETPLDWGATLAEEPPEETPLDWGATLAKETPEETPLDWGATLAEDSPAPPEDSPGTIEGIVSSAIVGGKQSMQSLDLVRLAEKVRDTQIKLEGPKSFPPPGSAPGVPSGPLGGLPNITDLIPKPSLRDTLGTDPNVKALTERIGERKGEIESYTRSPAVEKWNEAKGWDAVKSFISDPFEITANIMSESFTSSLSGIAGATAGGLLLGPAGSAIGAGGGELAMEYSSKLLSSLQESGVDVKNPKQLLDALSDDELMNGFRKKALLRGVPIAAINAFSAGIAGRFIGKALDAAEPALGSIVKASLKEMGQQAATEGGAELAGQAASGEDLSLKDAFTEIVGGVGPGVGETAVNLYKTGKMKRADPVLDPYVQELVAKGSEVAPMSADALKQTAEEFKPASDAGTTSGKVETPAAILPASDVGATSGKNEADKALPGWSYKKVSYSPEENRYKINDIPAPEEGVSLIDPTTKTVYSGTTHGEIWEAVYIEEKRKLEADGKLDGFYKNGRFVDRTPERNTVELQGEPEAAPATVPPAETPATVPPTKEPWQMTDEERAAEGWVGPLYHGSPDFQGGAFDRKYLARGSGLSRGGFSFTSDKESAESYMKSEVDPIQRSVDLANEAMAEAGKFMESGGSVPGFKESAELPEFNVRYVDDPSDFRSYLEELSASMPPEVSKLLQEAAKAEPAKANPKLVEAYIRNPKKVDVRGKTLWLAEDPKQISIRPESQATPAPTGAENIPAKSGETPATVPPAETAPQISSVDKIAEPELQPVEEPPKVAPPSPLPAVEGKPADTGTEAPLPEGPGAATATEFKPEPGTTSIKNAKVDEERAKRGLAAVTPHLRRKYGSDLVDEAMAEIDRDPKIQDKLIAELDDKPRAITDVEDVLLLHRQADLQNEYAKATRDLAKAVEESQQFPTRQSDVTFLQGQMGDLITKLAQVYDVGRSAGTQTARGLQARKMFMDEQFEITQMLAELTAKGGKKLSPEAVADVERQNKQIEDLQKAFDDYKAQADLKEAQRAANEEIDRMAREANKELRINPKILQIAEGIVKKLESKADESRLALNKLMGRTTMSFGANEAAIIYHASRILAGKLARATMTKAQAVADMVADIGESIRPLMDKIWDAANKTIEDEAMPGVPPAERKARTKVRIASAEQKATNEDVRKKVVEGITKAVGDERPLSELGDYIRKLALTYVRDGITDREKLVDAVHATVKDIVPDADRTAVLEAIARYGVFKKPDQEAAKRTFRDLAAQLLLVRKAQAVIAKEPIKPTGYMRDKPSDEQRWLTKELQELMRKHGVVVTDPENQLKSALDAIKTRLKNQIADLEFAMLPDNREATREKLARGKTPSPTDEEIKALEVRRDELEKQFSEIFDDKEMTDAQRVALAERALERDLAEYNRKISERDLGPMRPPGPQVTSDRLVELRAERDAKRAELEDLRAADEGWKKAQDEKYNEKALKSAQEGADELARRINEGEIASQKIPAREVSPEVRAARAERKELQGIVRKLQAALKNKASPEDVARKTIEELIAKIEKGDLSTKPRSAKPVSQEMQDLRAFRANLQRILNRMRAAAADTNEQRLIRLKARLTEREQDYRKKILRGDVSRVKRREIRVDKEAISLQAKLNIAHEAWLNKVFEAERANRDRWEKLLDVPKNILAIQRLAMTSLDVSGVLRQGGILAGSHPLEAGKAFGRMVQAGVPQAEALRAAKGFKEMVLALNSVGDQTAWARLQNRPNAADGSYHAAKLFLADPNSFSPKAIEENFEVAKWFKDVPGIKHSNAMYATFLNELRANVFDLLKYNLESRGTTLTVAELRGIANYINIATGRGDMSLMPGAAKFLSYIFFSPRLAISRFQYILGQPLYGKAGSWRVRRLLLKEYARSMSSFAVVASLALLAGGSIEKDPRSSDFMKFKFGNTRIDMLGGLQQPIVFLSRLASKRNKNRKGEIEDLTAPGRVGKMTWGGVVGNYLASKLAPWMGSVKEWYTGRDYWGRPVTVWERFVHTFAPMSVHDINKTLEEQGLDRGTVMSVLGLLGASLQTETDPDVKKRVKEAMKGFRGTPLEREKRAMELEEKFNQERPR